MEVQAGKQFRLEQHSKDELKINYRAYFHHDVGAPLIVF